MSLPSISGVTVTRCAEQNHALVMPSVHVGVRESELSLVRKRRTALGKTVGAFFIMIENMLKVSRLSDVFLLTSRL